MSSHETCQSASFFRSKNHFFKHLLFTAIGIVSLSKLAQCDDSNSAVARKCPIECPNVCASDTFDCKETVTDECGCCPVCLRDFGEECGDYGTCRASLQCVQQNDTTAVCVRPSMDACLHTACPVVFHPACASDSRLIIKPLPPGECCGSGGECVCDRLKCAGSVPECDAGTFRVLIRAAGDRPGKCCEQFECREREAHCHGHVCPPVPPDVANPWGEGDKADCPEDSVRPPTHLVPGQCCLLHPRCRCRASVCRPAVCPEGQSVRVLRKGNGQPGSCCDQWTCEAANLEKDCVHDGKRRMDGEVWPNSSCETCRCRKGVAVCSTMLCPKPPSKCTWVVVPTGECCPVCIGCQTEKMEKKKMNDTWSSDDCTTCTCSESGEPVCEKHMCRSECDNPRKVDGQCCPVCDEPTVLTLPSTCPSLEHCPLRCENGLARDERGCFMCDCLPSVAPLGTKSGCSPLDKENCEKQCAHGYLRDSAGCAVCRCAKCPPLHQCLKHCLYGFETNSVGCPVCKCRAMARIEAKLTVSEKLAKIAGWDRCMTYSTNGKVVERDGGEWWSDGCRHCFCEQRQEFCSLITCPEKPKECPEDEWRRKEGDCCASCTLTVSALSSSSSLSSKHEHTVCQSPGSGRLFTDGETWQLAPCVSCTCRVGHVLCRVADCQPIACAEPVLDPSNQCCTMCPPSESESTSFSLVPVNGKTAACMDEAGMARAATATWRTDDCTSCRCSASGKMECYRQSCGSLGPCRGVPLVLKGRCCPVCSDVLSSDALCTYGNNVYAVCREFVCPACSEPVPITGQCCPLCKDFGWASFGEGNGSVVMASDESSSTMALIGFSFLGVVGTAIFLVFLFILYKRVRGINKENGGVKKTHTPAVRLSATRSIGSQPFLHGIAGSEWEVARNRELGVTRRDSGGGQSESLLSTASSECSSSGASSSSSGHGSTKDTTPLTVSSSTKAKSSPSLKKFTLLRDDIKLSSQAI